MSRYAAFAAAKEAAYNERTRRYAERWDLRIFAEQMRAAACDRNNCNGYDKHDRDEDSSAKCCECMNAQERGIYRAAQAAEDHHLRIERILSRRMFHATRGLYAALNTPLPLPR